VSKSGAGINLSANKFIEFNVTSYTGAQTAWTVNLGSSGTGSTIGLSQIVPNSTGKISFDFNTWSGVLPSGFNFSSITSVQLQIDTINNGGVRLASSVTFDQMVAAVPAPGALALLGVAGIVGARRRRA
jgi:MYXO-CTERM domain-containing protein